MFVCSIFPMFGLSDVHLREGVSKSLQSFRTAGSRFSALLVTRGARVASLQSPVFRCAR